MEEFINAVQECCNPDFQLYYESTIKKAEYLLSIAKKYLAKNNDAMKYKLLKEFVDNSRNIGGLIEYNGQQYIADITTINCTPEFAVFKAVDEQITFDNAIPIFKKEGVDMNWDSWRECMEEFVKNFDEV